MSQDEGRVAGAPAVVILSGRSYRMSPLTDRDVVELDRWVRARVVQVARDSIPPDAPPEERDRIEMLSMRAAAGMTWMSGDGVRMIATIDGMVRLLWQSIKANHPELSEEQCRTLLLNRDNLREVNRGFRETNALDPTGGAQPPKKQQRRRGR